MYVTSVCQEACVDQLMLTITEVLQGGCDVDDSSPSKRAATVGSYHG